MGLTSLALLATLTISFSTDSTYNKDKIITVEFVEEDDASVTAYLNENYVLGYEIYDRTETEYIDGILFDGERLTDWKIENYDVDVEHLLLIKTVYSDDIAGTLAAAKDGDWSRVMENPLMLFQIFYYLLAAISIIAGGFGLAKSKKKKIKSAEEIASLVNSAATKSVSNLEARTLALVDEIIAPTFDKLSKQNQDVIEALILMQSGDVDSKLALVNLLKATATVDVNAMASEIKNAIANTAKVEAETKEEAIKTIKEIAQGVYEPEKDDGTSI